MRASLAAMLVTLFGVQALAAEQPFGLDFDLSKLGNAKPGSSTFDPKADGNFRVFAKQFAAALASVNGAPPETLGHSGFAITGAFSVADFGGGTLPTKDAFVGPLKFGSIHIRKGLPSSFELGARVTWVPGSRLIAGTAELKWAINEGFTYLPDIGIRGCITKLMNARDLDLTVGGVDIGVGKQFALGGMMTLTPYLGWNLLFVGASTAQVDFRPSRTQAEADGQDSSGAVNLKNLFDDVGNFTPLKSYENTYSRFYGGVRFVGGYFQLSAEFSYSILGRFTEATTSSARDIPAVLAGNFSAGFDF